MSAIIVGGVTVKAARDGVTLRPRTKTEFVPMFDESVRAIVRPRKMDADVETVPLTAAEVTTLEAQLHATALPITCSGDALGGSSSYLPQPNGKKPVRVGGVIRFVVSFTLWQA